MPEDKNAKTVDIDTSGPEVDVELEDTSKPEPEVIETVEQEAAPKAEKPSDEKVATEPQAASPSQQEASDENKTQKDELEDYSKDVQRRIAKLTKKWREAERQKEEALHFARVQKEEKEKLTRQFSSLETASVKDREARIASGLQAAKAKLAEARNAQDLNAEIDAQRDIARLGYEEARLMEVKATLEVASQDTRKVETPNINLNRSNESEIRPDPKAESWGAKNKWFGTDSAMTYTAFDIHKKLVDEEGYDASSDEYYAEIDKRIRLEFPHKFVNNATTETTKPVQVVASAKRSTKPSRKTVRLTPSQVAIAKKLGVPLEEYAKQLNITKEV
jgi:type II secretory pathway pseudopilin PulG